MVPVKAIGTFKLKEIGWRMDNEKEGMAFFVDQSGWNPDLLSVGISHTLSKSFFSSATRTWMGMKNYRDVLGNQAFWMAMKNTCFFLVVSILVLLLLSLFVARILLKNSIVNRIVKKGLLILRICHKGSKSGWGRCGQIVFLHSASTNEKAIFVHIAFCDHEWV